MHIPAAVLVRKRRRCRHHHRRCRQQQQLPQHHRLTPPCPCPQSSALLRRRLDSLLGVRVWPGICRPTKHGSTGLLLFLPLFLPPLFHVMLLVLVLALALSLVGDGLAWGGAHTASLRPTLFLLIKRKLLPLPQL